MPINRITTFPGAAGNAGTFWVTGGAGFIGSHLVDLLLQNGLRVTAVDDLSTGSLSHLNTALQYEHFSFLASDAAALDWETLLHSGDTVIHLAATVGVNKVCEDPLNTLYNNQLPVEAILRAMRRKPGYFFFAGSSEVYGDTLGCGAKESDWLKAHTHHSGRSAYTISKMYGEMLALAHAEKHGIPVTILRFFNTIGPRQTDIFGMVVPTFVRQAMTNEPITVYGDGSQTRSFCDVRDTVSAIDLLLRRRQTGVAEIFNIGNPLEINILELAHFIKKETGSLSPVQLLPFPLERAGKTDIRHRKPDISRISAATGWNPKYQWQDSIRQIIHQFEHANARTSA